MSLGTILLIVLILMLLGVLPTWPHARSWGYGPSGILGVVLVHASHGLVLAVWIASAAFAAVDVSLEEAARNLGASAWRCFCTVTLPKRLRS